MDITPEIISKVETYGARNYPVRYILQKLCKNIDDRTFLKMEFDNQDSEVSQAWERGKIDHEIAIDQHLEELLEQGGEGVGDVAKALNFRRKGREMDEMKREYYGV